jgi:hypothetical protein
MLFCFARVNSSHCKHTSHGCFSFIQFFEARAYIHGRRGDTSQRDQNPLALVFVRFHVFVRAAVPISSVGASEISKIHAPRKSDDVDLVAQVQRAPLLVHAFDDLERELLGHGLRVEREFVDAALPRLVLAGGRGGEQRQYVLVAE